MRAAGGDGAARRVDHLEPEQVESLVQHIDDDHGRLDVLVNDIFGGDRYAQWDKPLWEHDLAGGLRMLRMGVDTHLVTSAIAIPLLLRSGGGLVIEMPDGTTSFNTNFRQGVGFYYDLVKANIERIVKGLTFELAEHPVTALRVTPGAALAADDRASRFAGLILTSRQLADTYDITDTDGSRPDCWGLIDAYGIDHDSAEGIEEFR